MRDPFLRKVRSMVTEPVISGARDSVLVAVSGGPDSVAMLAALMAIATSCRFGVVHVNHRLRGRQSDADERFTVRLAKALDVPVFVREATLEAGGNLEERARERRYALFREVARVEGFRRIAVGHTLDDQAETVLLRLMRGAGVAGLGAMAPLRGDGIIRPLLGCTREEVLEFLRRQGLRYRRDASNRSVRFSRNRVRRKLLPLIEREFNPTIRATLARTATLLRDDEEYLRRHARAALRRIRTRRGIGAAGLLRLAPAIQRRAIREWLAAERGDLKRITAGHIDGVRSLAASPAGLLSLPGGHVVRSGHDLSWRAPGVRPVRFRVRIAEGRWVVAGRWRVRMRKQNAGAIRGRWRALFDPAALGRARIEARTPIPGDRIRPLGLGGSRKLQDVFVDAKVPREDRADWIVVTAGPAILWVPGLVRSEAAPLHGGSRDAIAIEVRRASARDGVAAK